MRTADPIGCGTITRRYIDALKEVGADPKLIEWAEARQKPDPMKPNKEFTTR